MPLNVHYLTPAGFDAFHEQYASAILMVAGHDSRRPAILPDDCPYVDIAMPSPTGGPCYEVWTTDPPVHRGLRHGVMFGSGGDVLMGVLPAAASTNENPEALAYETYMRLFDFMDSSTHPALLRIWNVLPDITGDTPAGERYHLFNRGRHEAFVAKRTGLLPPPAASGLGSRGGHPAFYFMAAMQAGAPIENPRQVSAYSYPPQYGPRSPLFSRAALASPDGQPILIVSGTASIVGHETRHIGDVDRQIGETVANIRALLAEAAKQGFTPAPDGASLKIYARHAEHRPLIDRRLAELLPATATMHLDADICRQDLLVEIEAVFR